MNASDIGANVSKTEFVNFLNSVKGGQFFHVSGYQNQSNEVSNYILRFGIKYESIKAKDEKFIREALRENSNPLTVKVTHGVWIEESKLSMPVMQSTSPLGGIGIPCTAKFNTILDGKTCPVSLSGIFDPSNEIFMNRKSKSRVPVTLSYTVAKGHPLFTNALNELLQSNIAPRPASVEYDREGKSCYSYDKEDGSPVKWYLRDVLTVKKTVITQGDYAFKATGASVAIREAIAREFLLTSRYRQFILTEGKFNSITIEGQAVMVDGVDEAFYMALPEHVKANTIATALAV